MKVSELLKKFRENPDDLAELVIAISKVEEMEKEQEQHVDRVLKLQENNRKLLQQIPVTGDTPKKEEPKPPSIADAIEEIRKLQGGNE